MSTINKEKLFDALILTQDKISIFLERIDIYMDFTKLKVTYEELFELSNCSITEYNETQEVQDDIYVDTPQGYKKINACIVKPECKMLNIKFSNGTECNVAETHIFSYNNKEIFAKDITYVDSKNGELKVISKTNIGNFDGFDINIDYPHWYYNDNDIIYHNTLLMTDIISGQIKMGKNVLLVSMEMQDREMMKRVHANALDLPINDLANLDPLVIRNAKEAVGKHGKLFIKDYPTGSFSPLMLDSLLDTYKIEKNIEFDIVYLDYLGIMKSDLLTPSAGLYSYVKSIVEETRSIAGKRKIPIVSASQLNRSATGNNLDIKNVNNDSVSDSIGTVQTADFIMFLLQNEEMKEQNIMTCKCTKNRFTGRTDYWDMNIDYNKMRFSDVVVNPSDIGASPIGMKEEEINTTLKTITTNDIKIIQQKDQEIKEDFDVLDELGLS